MSNENTMLLERSYLRNDKGIYSNIKSKIWRNILYFSLFTIPFIIISSFTTWNVLWVFCLLYILIIFFTVIIPDLKSLKVKKSYAYAIHYEDNILSHFMDTINLETVKALVHVKQLHFEENSNTQRFMNKFVSIFSLPDSLFISDNGDLIVIYLNEITDNEHFLVSLEKKLIKQGVPVTETNNLKAGIQEIDKYLVK